MLRSHHFSAILIASPSIFDWTEANFLDSLKSAAQDAHLTPVGQLSFTFQPQGVSAVLLLEESHVALHFWPEEGKVTVDIHVCDYQQDNYEKAKTLAELLTLEIGDNSNNEQWKYFCVTS
ncbi:S-adenosylmethionine decarboxylase [Trichocoleus sp. Lan]|uniref:S-adenosylmethionine decarboxylase n=1 Tax=Cyanophyceae TaxID=3028117 RepID=UPI001682964E|nr:S-adenosylmethionine decarboxylase [Coleofasciculus sp. FACHB-542]